MSQRDSSEAEGESSEPVPNGTSPAKTMAPTAPTAPTPPPYANGHAATRQSPMIDPNVMMMTNAAATIAAAFVIIITFGSIIGLCRVAA